MEKLKQRYQVPKTLEKRKTIAIQVRVIIAIKYWLETQIQDFDEDLVVELQHFLDSTGKDGHTDMSNSLKKLLVNQIGGLEQRTRLMLNIPPKIPIPDNGLSFLDLILMADPLTIAQQLTLIDFGIYSRIKATELLNQSWNKAKLKHRSPNVVALITRSTRLSFWLATTVLYCDKRPQRVKAIEQMIDVASHLFTMNNFNTLMSIVAGLNLSAVHRLKKTFKKISSDRIKTFEKLHAIMRPDASFKSYRSSLMNAAPPILPYVGISLTDLTFIEDGNQDGTAEQVNFKKRELLYKSIREVIQYQVDTYQFEIVEPLNTFLQEVPYIPNDEDLYELSLFLEPRESK